MTIAGSTTPVGGGILAAPARSLTRVFAVIGLLTVILLITFFVLRPSSAMRAQRIAARDSARRAADSITRIRLAAQNPPAPPALSHDDSIAIAEKVNKRVRASRLRDSVARAKLQDSLQRVEEKKARDSIFKAYGARPAATTKRRVVAAGLAQIGRAHA